jgi:hypothetical protein
MHKLACLYMSVVGYGMKVSSIKQAKEPGHAFHPPQHCYSATGLTVSLGPRRAVDAAVPQAGPRRRAAAGHAAALRCAGNSYLVFNIALAGGAPPRRAHASALCMSWWPRPGTERTARWCRAGGWAGLLGRACGGRGRAWSTWDL